MKQSQKGFGIYWNGHTSDSSNLQFESYWCRRFSGFKFLEIDTYLLLCIVNTEMKEKEATNGPFKRYTPFIWLNKGSVYGIYSLSIASLA